MSTKGTKKSTASARIQLTPLVKALLLEDAERQQGTLVDLADNEVPDGPLLFFVGSGRIFLPAPYEPVVELPELGLPADAAEAIEGERELQAASIADDRGVLVWVGGGQRTLACIAAASLSDRGAVVSYRSQPAHGLLGMLEQELEGVAVIKALFLWRQPPV